MHLARRSVYTGRMPRRFPAFRPICCSLLLALLGGCGQTGGLFLRMPPVTYTPIAAPTPLKSVPVLMPAGSTMPAAVTAPAAASISQP